MFTQKGDVRVFGIDKLMEVKRAMTKSTDKEKLPSKEPIVHPEISRITCEELKQWMEEGVSLTLVDTRWEGSFRRERIKGAVNIPDAPLPPVTEEIVAIKLESLPRNKPAIFYCDCQDDAGSAGLALKLIETGFDAARVKVLSKGWQRWLELGYPREDFTAI
jgi:rhodanese-related sulfurtransferase